MLPAIPLINEKFDLNDFEEIYHVHEDFVGVRDGALRIPGCRNCPSLRAGPALGKADFGTCGDAVSAQKIDLPAGLPSDTLVLERENMGALWLNWTSYLDLAIETALIANLFRNDLHRIYRLFVAYLAADAVESFAGMLAQTHYKLYGEIYFTGQGLKIVLGVFVVLELFQLALRRHPALARYGRGTVVYAMIASVLLAGFAIVLDRSIAPAQSVFLHRFNTFERTMDLAMLLFLAIITAFMVWFPVQLTRNSVLYIGGFVFYFLSRSAGLLLHNLAPQFRNPIDNVLMAACIGCLLIWLLALTRRGEEVKTQIGHSWNPQQARRLAEQLDAINSKLMMISRK